MYVYYENVLCLNRMRRSRIFSLVCQEYDDYLTLLKMIWINLTTSFTMIKKYLKTYSQMLNSEGAFWAFVAILIWRVISLYLGSVHCQKKCKIGLRYAWLYTKHIFFFNLTNIYNLFNTWKNQFCPLLDTNQNESWYWYSKNIFIDWIYSIVLCKQEQKIGFD